MNARLVQIFSILVILGLVGCIFYSGALTNPYSGYSPSYSVANESSTQSEIDRYELSTANPKKSDNLSEESQAVFYTAMEQEPNQFGWKSAGEVPICDDALLICDAHESPPDFPTHGEDTYESYSVVESEDEIYIVRTGMGPSLDFGPLIEFFVKLTTLGAYTIFLAAQVRYNSSKSPQRVLRFAGYGAILLLFAMAYPYILMFANISVSIWHLFLFSLVTLSVIVFGVVSQEQSFREDSEGNI